MKKKFYGALLLGSLFLAGGMVSCSDYDDDINALNTKVDEINQTLSSLQSQIGSYVKSVSYDPATGKLTVVDSADKTYTYDLPQMQTLPEYTLEVTADGKVVLKKDGQQVSEGQIDFPEVPEIPDAFDPTKLTVSEDGIVMYDGKATGVSMPTSTGMIALKDDNGNIYAYAITVTENGKVTTATFYVLDAVPLKGLVFKPTCLVNGVPSLKAANISYEDWSLVKAEVSKDGEKFTQSTTTSYITPQIWAYYHMNPSSVTKAQMESMTFLSDDVESYSRAAAMNPTVDFEKTVVTEDHLLKVAMNANAEEIPDVDENKQALYALQVTTKAVGEKEAAVITSDYASIYRVGMSDFLLKVNIEGDDETVYGQFESRAGSTNTYAGKALDAINNDADFSVEFDDEKNIADLITVWYKEAGNTEYIKMDKIADYGFELRYSASNYLGGDAADTQQNSFFNTADAAEGIFNPEYSGADNRNTIGRKPMIRVELVDTEANQVVTVGWIKANIVDGEIGGFGETFDKGEYVYGCDEFEAKLTYLDMNDVYAKAGMSKEEFHTVYTLEGSGTGIILAPGSTGLVTEVTSATETQTDIVEWSVAPTDVAAAKNNDIIFATMTYKSNDVTRGDITITLQATVAKPSGKVDNACKIAQAWFNTYTYIKADVNEPIATPANDFTIDLLSVFEGRKVTINNVDSKFTSFAADKLNTKFQFGKTADVMIGNDVYTFSVSADGLTLNATKGLITQEVATMDANGVITYGTSDYAKVLLNKSAYNDDPFTVGIEIVATNDCSQVLPLTNNTFDVKFLRPINAHDKKTAELTDATTGTAKIDMSELMGLTDWRGEEFADSPVNFYEYYGITDIVIDRANIMTTLNASETAPKKLSEVAPNMNIDYIKATTLTDDTYGDVVYTNNDHTFHTEFQLYIPVTVTYTFGSVQTTVTLTILPTQGNN